MNTGYEDWDNTKESKDEIVNLKRLLRLVLYHRLPIGDRVDEHLPIELQEEIVNALT